MGDEGRDHCEEVARNRWNSTLFDRQNQKRGLSNSDIRASLEDSPHLRDLALNPKKQSAKVSRILNRFHAHKLIAKIPRTRRWRVTDRGKQIMAASLCLRDIAFPELFRKNAAA